MYRVEIFINNKMRSESFDTETEARKYAEFARKEGIIFILKESTISGFWDVIEIIN